MNVPIDLALRAPAGVAQPGPAASVRSGRSSRTPRWWFGALVAAICLEGIGRKFLSGVPSAAWYFLKDVILILGLAIFGISRETLLQVARLYRPFGLVLLAAVAWSLVQVLNPAQTSLLLASVGLRSYWLWWLAPLVIASTLRRREDVRAAVLLLTVTSLAVAALAALQFQFPAEAAINRYAWSDESGTVAGVAETGRVRVSSTFSYLTGFTDFLLLVLPLLLAFGLEEARRRTRLLIWLAAASLGVVLPMSGARSPILLTGLAVLVIFWSAGAFASRKGRALLLLVAGLSTLPFLASPDAVAGVAARFEYDDVGGRFGELWRLLPPIALMDLDYPLFGLGTGMQQSVRVALGIFVPWNAESPTHRQLIELGAVGHLLVWTALAGISVGMVRVARTLRRRGQRALAGLSLVLAGYALIGNPVFDHVWQALFFTALGLLLAHFNTTDPARGGAPMSVARRRESA